MQVLKTTMLILLLGLAVIYAALIGYIYAFQRTLQYHPDPAMRSPESVGLDGFDTIALKSPDGESIIAWHKPAAMGRPTILYFHGNAGSISTRPRKIGYFGSTDYGMLAVSYRGYGGSTGSPSEPGLVADAETAYRWLTANGVAADQILVLGESLGSGVAVQLAAKYPVRALALEAPYSNAVDIGAARYWYLPVRFLMHDQFRSSDHIAMVKAPLLVTHGVDDRLIPIEQGRKLFALAHEPKTFVEVPGGGHEIIGEEATWMMERAFFERVVNTPAAQ